MVESWIAPLEAGDPEAAWDLFIEPRAGTRTTVLGGLTRPTSIAIGPDGALYVTNRGIWAGLGEVLRLEAALGAAVVPDP